MQKGVFRIRKVLNCCLLALSTVLLIIILNNLMRPIYINYLDKDISLGVVATAQQNEDALANNVRITHVTINGKDKDLSKVTIDPESQWKYDSKNDFLYAYNLKKSDELVLDLKGVHSLEVTLVQEVGSGLVTLKLDGENWEEVDLYKNIEWGEVSYSYNTSTMVFWENQITILFGLWLICFVAWIVLINVKLKAQLVEKIKDLAIEICFIWHLAFLTVLLVLLVQYRNNTGVQYYLTNQPQLFIKSIVLSFVSLQMLYVLIRRLDAAFMINALAFISLPIISNIKLLNRGVPLLPWDFSMAGEALSVVSSYEINLESTDIIAIALIGGFSCFLFYIHRKGFQFKNVRRPVSIVFLVVLVFYVRTNYISNDVEANNVDYRVYQVDKYYYDRGFLTAFLEFGSYMDIAETPVGYSRTRMLDIRDQILNKVTNDNDKKSTPNIIAIMDESFWDAERLDTVQFSEELLPNYNQLKTESCYGELFTHVLSGGTVTSEFEFLTGLSGEFFPQDYMVYGGFLYNDFPSAVKILENQGYSTLGIHPYISTNYNREAAYEKLGFDECIFDADFNNVEVIRNYVSDKSTFDRIIKEFEAGKSADNPQFIFTVTMQNHGGYWEETINETSSVEFQAERYGNVAQACMTDYFAGLHETDRALGELIDYFRESDKETIIVFFGDHMSDAGPKDDRMFAQTSWKENSLTYDYETHRVPFLVWSNFESSSEDWGIMEIGQLLPSVFSKYNIEMPAFWEFLLSQNKEYSATDNRLIIDTEGNYFSLSDMNESQKKVYEMFRLLQYDCIWGEHYASDLWKISAR